MSKKVYILRFIFAILLLLMFFTIFNFSAQDGEESSGLSGRLTEFLTQNIKYIQNLEETEKEELLSKIEAVVRKMAHFFLYTLVGIFAISLLNTYEMKVKKKIRLSFLIGVFYAILDELHQLIVPDRNGSVMDVLLDSTGVIFGIVIGYMCFYAIYKIRQKNLQINN